MENFGYNRSLYDYCVLQGENGSLIYLVLYVYDMLILAKKNYDIQKLKVLLSAEFEVKDLGAALKILGIEIYRDRSQKKIFFS